ncbi:ferrous iron transport protein B [Spiroplasma eriocheiris]|uniref:Ferrous iron transport protein B n=1 Tax=Spiroplasma eriocheiris TaxID=315358 RepID=A0A0H3XLZ4_9MOLU|nr:ferrous iron transport protein B [Spiroplasma eriocheiris]AHF57405.1 ferrous iron transport protein B [Spiroplasma eriocheiris CCTCC M 207170]AKM53862.1 ferrous iron transporter B [Spiroplasma eriocheiris]
MSCHNSAVKSPKKKDKNNYFLLVGSPNIGKSTFFNHLTNKTTIIGNFDRTTVAPMVGKIKQTTDLKLMDLPGIYNLNARGDDDNVVLNTIFKTDFSGILNVLGANSFLRDMHLTIQLLETQKPLVLSINMVDELKNQRILNNKLAKMLTCPVVLTVAKTNKGLNNVQKELACPLNAFKLNYGNDIESKITQITEKLTISGMSKRFLAIQLLENNQIAIDYLKNNQENYEEILALTAENNNANQEVIYQVRFDFIKKLYQEIFVLENSVLAVTKNKIKNWHEKVDYLLLKRTFGLPIFVLLLVGLYYITFGPYTGGFLNEKLDYLFNDLLLTLIKDKMLATNAHLFLTGLICDGILAGLFAVLPFIPYILILFLFVGLFQQSGYLARVSVLTDQLLSPFGLSGRSVINLISGMGCNVPAIMMARSTTNKKEKFISIFIAPFISCSARATVFAFVASMIFTKNTWLVVFILQIFSGLTALLIGLLFSKTMFRKKANLFLIEVPKWRTPDFLTIIKLMWLELKTFLIRAGKFILLGSIIVWLFSHLGIHGVLTDEQIDQSFIGYVGRGLSYLFMPLGLNDWRMATSLLLAFPAKELAISNMTIVFGSQTAISSFFNLANGISFMLFFLLYIPCLSTMAVIKKETNWKMLVSNALFSLATAYIIGVIGYWIFYPLI